jgi:hypothetical protein
MKRREFLGGAAASGAVLTMPAFISGCGIQQATAVANKTPENPFMDWFGVDQATTAQVMSELSANGADAADLLACASSSASRRAMHSPKT